MEELERLESMDSVNGRPTRRNSGTGDGKPETSEKEEDRE